jgi:hypothetical protein
LHAGYQTAMRTVECPLILLYCEDHRWMTGRAPTTVTHAEMQTMPVLLLHAKDGDV